MVATDPVVFIYILDDDSLLNIFSFCRPLTLDMNVVSNDENPDYGQWNRE